MSIRGFRATGENAACAQVQPELGRRKWALTAHPSSGIRGFRTEVSALRCRNPNCGFQSLFRDSWLPDQHASADFGGDHPRFNPSSGIRGFRTQGERSSMPFRLMGFNPSSGIRGFRTKRGHRLGATLSACFNPSSGIRGFRTRCHGLFFRASPACFNPSSGIRGFRTAVCFRP